MRLKLINKTSWDTRDLRRLVLKCLEHRGWDKNREHRTEIVSARRPFVSGWAYYNRPFVRMKVPNGRSYSYDRSEVFDCFNTKSFVKVLLHEIDHNLGLHHKEMADSDKLPLPSFAESFIVHKEELKVASPNPKEVPRKRYERIILKIDDKQRKIKRLQNALKKLVAQKKYYIKKYSF